VLILPAACKVVRGITFQQVTWPSAFLFTHGSGEEPRLCGKFHRSQRLRFSRTEHEPDRVPNIRRAVRIQMKPRLLLGVDPVRAKYFLRVPSEFAPPTPIPGNEIYAAAGCSRFGRSGAVSSAMGLGMPRPNFCRRLATWLAGGNGLGPGHECTDGSGWCGRGRGSGAQGRGGQISDGQKFSEGRHQLSAF
jgi:hypothetical protein